MDQLRKKKGFICDMDGVIYHGNRLLPGVKEFVDWLYREEKNFLFLTNSSERSPKELQQKLQRIRPRTVGQAARISGVSPADISVLLIWIEQQGRIQIHE